MLIPLSCVALAVSLFLATSSLAFRHTDVVSSLPGLDRQPRFRQYSGYLGASETARLHYWFVESQSRPETDPLILWLNGGPGCSSVDGLLTENGPFRVNEDGKTLQENAYSWNKIANVLYLESPAGVGFSYDTRRNYTTDDDQVATRNLAAIKDFLARFPEYADRDLFITGESYAGIYIPTLMRQAHEDGSIQLKGALIGNGYLIPAMFINSKIHYWYFHGIIGTGLWERLLGACCLNQRISPDECQFVPFTTLQCRDVLLETTHIVGDLPLNPYNVYSACRGSEVNSVKKAAMEVASLLKQLGGDIEANNRPFRYTSEIDPTSGRQAQTVPCIDNTNVEKYLNLPAVRRALNIRHNTGLPDWTTCSSLVRLDYSLTPTYRRLYDDMRPILKTLVEQNYRIWIFNGDLDTVCDFYGDEEITDSLMFEEVRAHQPWFYNDERGLPQIGGFFREFKNNFTFLTVKGAGHMVPTDQPRSVLNVIRKFLLGKFL